ncbi:MAG: lysylphosphatidylglycerol synthase transmembrane domain-containing protein [Bradyrhizobium sp.]|uniref:lysylphosphatidylglycerol synthase transmembrane domain-containing protein n=1 Tax=Bradyrhizobium sp. TaxID=376 RepID=UPI003D0DF72D
MIGVAALAWVLRRLDLERLRADLAGADVRFILLVPLAIVAEQWVRAWKWRQLLHSIKPGIDTLHLLGAIMAGFLVGMLVPLGAGALARSWLVARREALTTSGVLATVALDRLTDGIVFALLIPVALVLVAFPDPAGDIRAGLAWVAVGSLVLFGLLLLALSAYRRDTLREGGHVLRLARALPERIAGPVRRVLISFAEGVSWPRELWRGLGIVLASAAMKLIAATHFLWAGLAFGVLLAPGTYLFLTVFLGFVAVLGHWARVPGSFIVAAIFALGLFGVAEATALAMVLVVQGASLLSVAALGALALWRQGVALADLRTAQRAHEAGG